MNPAAPVALELDHLHAFAAWLAHGPGTVRQIAGKADLPLTLVHPRTLELQAIGALTIEGQSASEGPIYLARASAGAVPSTTDVVQRQLNTLPKADRVSIAAGIMAKEGKRNKATRAGGREQAEIPLG